jgi:DNA polymerase-1
MTRPRIFLLDSAAVAYRAYFAFIKNPLTNRDGLNTSAVFGFANILLTLLEKERPEFFAAVFDSREPTFRHRRYPAYKATREKMPEDMAASLPYIDRLVDALAIPRLSLPGYEADDVIGTLAVRAGREGLDAYIVSGDKDFMQLIGPGVRMYNPKRPTDLVVMGEEDVREKFGVAPDRVVDVLALMGDASDNVPGVPGVGEKTASALINEFGSFDALYRDLARVKREKVRELLKQHRDQARMSRELVTIDVEAPVGKGPRDLVPGAPDLAEVRDLFQELEFTQLLRRVEAYAEGRGPSRATPPTQEPPDGEAIPPVASGGDLPLSGSADYRTLLDRTSIAGALEEAARSGAVAVDLETTGLDPLACSIVGVALSWRPAQAVYIPFNAKGEPARLMKALAPFLEDPKVSKGGQNSKFDQAVLRANGVEPAGFGFDTMVESYLLDASTRQHNLDALALKHFGHVKIPTESLIGKGKKQTTMDRVEVEKVAAYACEDADFTLRLHRLFEPRLKAERLWDLYREVEMPLVSVLGDMERRGIEIDTDRLADQSAEAARALERLTREIHALAGREFNIASPQQLGRVLFEDLQVQKGTGVRAKRTQTGYATDQDVLEALAGEGLRLAELVLEYRQTAKLKNTYLDVLPSLRSPKDGRIHTSFNQTVAATGRLSSSDPNLQNIPVRTELGRRVREAFVARRGHRLLSADYSQIELRVLAHLSGDANLLRTFEREEDVHARTASLVFGVEIERVTREQRNAAKTINFGVIYGMGPQRLARENKVPLEEAKRFIESYFAKYPRIREYTEAQVAQARSRGYVETLLGRKRPIPEIRSSNPGLRVNAEHMAVNTPIQGSAADLIKVAMVRLHRRLVEKGMGTAMLLQVHDELVFESPKAEVAEATKIIVREMEGAMELKVPLRVEVGEGGNWLEAH